MRAAKAAQESCLGCEQPCDLGAGLHFLVSGRHSSDLQKTVEAFTVTEEV